MIGEDFDTDFLKELDEYKRLRLLFRRLGRHARNAWEGKKEPIDFEARRRRRVAGRRFLPI